MQQLKKVTRYSSGSKVLHWLIALLVIMMLAAGFFLSELASDIQPMGYLIHKSIGLTILALMVMRIFWITHSGRPALPNTVPRWERLLSRAVQYSLYVLLIVMPLCGWIMSVTANHIPVYFGLFEVPIPGLAPNEATSHFFKLCHNTIAWILSGLISLHILGAFKHYIIDKDCVLESMLPED